MNVNAGRIFAVSKLPVRAAVLPLLILVLVAGCATTTPWDI